MGTRIYTTEAGWKRSTKQDREYRVEVLKSKPVAFKCACNKCECGSITTKIISYPVIKSTPYGRDQKVWIEKLEIPYCPKCGRIKISKGRVYGLEHATFCKPKKKGRRIHIIKETPSSKKVCHLVEKQKKVYQVAKAAGVKRKRYGKESYLFQVPPGEN